MFREIDPEPVFDEEDEIEGDHRLLEISEEIGYKEYLEDAAVHKALYEFELTGLLRRQDPNSVACLVLTSSRYNINETECVAGLLLRSPKTRLRVDKDYDLRVSPDCVRVGCLNLNVPMLLGCRTRRVLPHRRCYDHPHR